MKIIPAIDLIDGKTVRLEQGEYDRQLSYTIDPVEAAKKWESMGAEMIHVVDLDGARQGKPINLEVAKKIVNCVNVPIEIGGGYRSIEDIENALSQGISRVIVGSRAFEDYEFARLCVNEFVEKVIFSFDVKGFSPSVRGWKKTTDVDFFEILDWFIEYGAKEIIYTDITRDGMLSGPNIENLKKILSKGNIKVISAGGVKNLEHILELKKLEDMGLSGVIVGRAIYDGTLDLKGAIDACKKNNTLS
jgi:phosphoribosylformimino-5-aminoimidazole carboxamide ribotide isomerase